MMGILPALAGASAPAGAAGLFASHPWLWGVAGAVGGGLLTGAILVLANALWARGVRRIWNAPELSETLLQRLRQLPIRLRAWWSGQLVAGSGLTAVWQRFASQLPPAVRSRLLEIPTVVMLGGPKAGKTTVIDTFVDWPSMQGQFLPSLRDESLPLRISLGSRLVVHELAASVLTSNSPATAEALAALWQPLCRVQKPMVVVVIDASRLAPDRQGGSAVSESLVNEARVLSGKLGLLSRLCKGQIKVRLCLSHMDTVPGFASLQKFCAAQRLPLRVALQAAQSTSGQPADLLSVYRRYRPLALLRSKPEDYAGVVRFLHEMPSRLRLLEPYLEELVRDPIRRLTPTLDRLYLFSNQATRGEENPLVHASKSDRRRRRGLISWFTRLRHGRPHLLLAGVAATVLSLVLGLGFYIDGQRVGRIDHDLLQLAHAIKRTAGSQNPAYASSELHTLVAQVGHQLHDLEKNDARLIGYRTLRQKRKQQARELFVTAVRNSQLLPLLERYKNRQRDDQMLMTLAVIHATSRNSLAPLVVSHLNEWATRLEIPPSLIADYVHFSDRPYEDRSHLHGLFTRPADRQIGIDQPSLWYEELVAIEKYYAAQSLDPSALSRLREQLSPYLKVVDSVGKDLLAGQSYRLLSEVVPWSVAEIHRGRAFSLAPPAWLHDQLSAFRGLLQLLCSSGDERGGPPQNLYQALRLLIDADGSKAIPDEVFNIDLEGRAFSFSARRWLELLRRSRRGQVVYSLFHKRSDANPNGPDHNRRQQRSKRHQQPEVSFPSPVPGAAQSPYDPELLRRDIVPILRDLDHKLEQRSQLGPSERQALERFVGQESQRFARAYCDDLRSRYLHFSLSAGRVETTLAELRTLLQKDGTLASHLLRLATGVNVGELDGPYLKPLRDCLQPFVPVARLATPDQDGNLAELKPYAELIAELTKQLEGAPAKLTEDGAKVTLRDALSPAGRIALALLEAQPENLRQRFVRFLQERQVAEPLQGPLLAPLRHVFGIGQLELERTLARLWEQGPRAQLSGLFELYPFRRQATVDATLAELAPLRPQQGELWQAVGTLLGPVVVRQGGRWRARPLPGGTPLLPADLLGLLNRADEVGRRLFGVDGQPQKLSLLVSAASLRGLPEGTVGLRSFLLSGKSNRNVFAPSGVMVAQTLVVDWNQPAVAAVGVELQVGSSAPQTQSIDGPESGFSLYRLLDRARFAGRVATWELPSGSEAATGGGLSVSFSFAADPFAPFQSPQLTEVAR